MQKNEKSSRESWNSIKKSAGINEETDREQREVEE